MRRAGVAVFAVLAAAALVAPAFAEMHMVKVSTKQGVGSYLADAKGMTLYWYTMDTPGKSACAGQCAERWPIYYVESVMAPTGLKTDEFGSITRDDGKKQTTFRGYPLYYWMNDKAVGDTTGQGVGGVWFVIDPANFPPKK